MRRLHSAIAIAIVMAVSPSAVDAALYSDNFDTYVAGSNIQGQGDFIYWDNSEDLNSHGLVSDAFAFSGSNSLMLGGHGGAHYTDPVWQFADANTGVSPVSSGQWTQSAMVYIPGDSNTNYVDFNYMSSHPAPLTWSGNPRFQMANDVVTGPNGGSMPMAGLRDRWFEVVLELDLDAGQGEIFVDGALLSTYDWNAANGNEFDGIDYWAPADSSALYVDDISLTAVPEPSAMVLSVLACMGLMLRRKRSA